jgi:transcriptional regulator with XRE-family HTH domain
MKLNHDDNLLRAKLVAAREDHKVSQAALARMVGMDPSVLNKIESGKRKISASELKEFSQALNVSLDYLLSYDSSLSEDERDKFDVMIDEAFNAKGKLPTKNDRDIVKSIIEKELSEKNDTE